MHSWMVVGDGGGVFKFRINLLLVFSPVILNPQPGHLRLPEEKLSLHNGHFIDSLLLLKIIPIQQFSQLLIY